MHGKFLQFFEEERFLSAYSAIGAVVAYAEEFRDFVNEGEVRGEGFFYLLEEDLLQIR